MNRIKAGVLALLIELAVLIVFFATIVLLFSLNGRCV